MQIRTFADEECGLPVIYGKYPKGGSCVASAGKVIIIGQFSELKDQNAAACNDTIQMMARYLAASSWPSTSTSSGDSAGGVSAAITDAQAKISWEPFCKQMLIGKGNVKECAICSKSDGKVYAAATIDSVNNGKAVDFSLQKYETEMTQEDGTDKLVPINESASISTLMGQQPGMRPASGLRFNKVKYQFIRGGIDDDSKCNTCHGKKTRGGCVVSVTAGLIIIATFDENINHTGAGCATSVSDLAKYLKSQGM